MYKLVIQDDEGKTTVVPLIRDELTIGRQEGNTIRLTERNVSRRHAKLHREQAAITIEDLDSYNGVRVNGSRIQGRAEIKEADRVQIGDYLIEVKSDQPKKEVAEPKTKEFKKSAANIPSAVPEAHSDSATVPVLANSDGTPSHPLPEKPKLAEPAEGYARLVVLSTSMAGREFELDKPAMVIGRTDENDIWVNHRSISRHHAKLVREKGSYSVVDLQSANGVRVNGEEYGKVELRRGDVVDLGHVRLRYVAPGEDFVFGRDAQAIDISNEGGKGRALWIALGVLAVAMAAFVILGEPFSNKPASSGSVPVTYDASVVAIDNPDPPPASTIDASVAVDPPDTTSQDLAKHLAAALAAGERDDWAAMKVAAEAALALDTKNSKAMEYIELADFEENNKKIFSEFEASVGGRKWGQIASLFAKIDSASTYKIKAQPDHDRLKADYLKFQVQVATKKAKRGKCSDLQRMARQTPDEWPEVKQAILRQKCKQAVAPPVNDPDPKTDPEPVASYEELMEQATSASKATQYGKSMKYCQKALVVRPGDQQGLIVCAIAACNLKKEKSARKFVRGLNSARYQKMARQICLLKGVELD